MHKYGHGILTPGSSRLHAMSGEKHLAKVVKDAVSKSSNGEVSMIHADRIKDFVRNNPETGPSDAWSSIAKHFSEPNIIKRTVALELCNILFLRSQRFRSCVIDGFDTFELLSENCGGTKQSARFLSNLIRILNTWGDKFGANSQTLALAVNHLKSKILKVGLLVDSSEATEDKDDQFRWEAARIQAQVDAEFSKIACFTHELEETLRSVLTALYSEIGGNLVDPSSAHNASRNDFDGDHLLRDLGLVTSNYELEISLQKPRIMCEKRKVKFLVDGAEKAKAQYLPRLVEWDQRMHKLGVNEASQDVMHLTYQEISSCFVLLSKTLKLLDSVSLFPHEVSSDDDLEDVPL